MTDFGPDASAAVLFVQEGQNTFLGKAEETLTQAQAQLAALSHFATTATTFSVDFNFTDQLTPFVRPPTPVLVATDFDLRPQEQPGLPPVFEAQTPDIGEAPLYDVETPVFSFPTAPLDPNIALPVAPPAPAPLVMPVEPDYQQYIPAPVTLRQLNLPTFTPLVLPEFTSVRPQIQPFDLGETGNFTPQEYVSALLDKVTARVSTWMDGQEALPLAIRRALLDRGRQQVVLESQAQIEQVYDEFGTRGFTLPTGQLAAQVEGVRQAAQNRVADFNRETTIKEFDEALANMRLAVQSGIQLEGVTINLHVEEQRLLLQSAIYLRDTSVAVLNARIAQFNAEMQGYGIDAQVLESKIKAALASLEETRLLLEGQKLVGDMNEQDVRLYGEQWNAVKSLADFYRSRIEAVKVQGDANLIPIEIFKGQCQAFETLWSANAKQWDGYSSGIQGETSKSVLHRNLVDAFTARTNGAVQFGTLKLDREKLRLAEHQQDLSVYDAGLRRLGQLLDAERARLAAVGTKAAAEATIYRARADVESAASAAADRSFQRGLEEARARVDTQLETARIRSNENVALQNLMAEIAKALAQIMSQLAASTMSAVNYSANVGASDSYGHNRSVAWQGDANDYTGPTSI